MDSQDDAMDVSPVQAVETVLSAGATATALTSTVASVGAVAATAAVGLTEAHMPSQGPLVGQANLVDTSAPSRPPSAAAWEANLEPPAGSNPPVDQLMQVTRCEALGLNGDNVKAFMEASEFISLGCLCAVANALYYLGLRRNSYPFDWVRTPLEGIMHCLDVHFEDFLTYSTYSVAGPYAVFGGTRWGGSFWHHNVELPITRQDMARRVSRFYGRENVAVSTPRVFVRCVNSTREVNAALRFRQALRTSLPDLESVLLLLIVDMQPVEGLMGISGQEGKDFLVYGILEAESLRTMSPGADAFKLCSENYSRAIASAIKYWAGSGVAEPIRMFSSLSQLGSACVQFDGGDPSRELFTPRKFYGQDMCMPSQAPKFQNLFPKMQTRQFLIPQNTQVTIPMKIECFGRCLNVSLPVESLSGDCVNLLLNDGVLSAIVTRTLEGQLSLVGPAWVTEMQ